MTSETLLLVVLIACALVIAHHTDAAREDT